MHDLLDYDKDAGIFTRKIDRRKHKAGSVSGTRMLNGYITVYFNQKRMLAHRLAWLYVYGEYPKNEIDHINGDRSDNRIANLREATAQQNAQNKKPQIHKNKLGLVGVYFDKKAKKFKATLVTCNRKKHLGSFDDPYKAHVAYINAKRFYHSYSNI